MITKEKAEAFAQVYVKNGFNGTEALRTVEPKNSKEIEQSSLHVKSTRMLSNVKVEKALRELMAEDDSGLTNKDLNKILKRNAKQSKNIAASNTAAELALKVKGEFAPEEKRTLNIDITPENVNTMLQALQAQLETLRTLEIKTETPLQLDTAEKGVDNSDKEKKI